MKERVLFLFALLSTLTATAQTAFQDAKDLVQYFSFNEDLNILELKPIAGSDRTYVLAKLQAYCPESVKTRVDGQLTVDLETCFEANPFLLTDEIFQELSASVLSESAIGSGRGEEMGPGRPQGGKGGSFVTNLADGLARFIVKRTKEELNAAFFIKLREAMKDQREFQTLFPTTFELTVNAIGEEIYHYNAYIEALREGFVRDMKTLPMNMRDYVAEGDVIKREENKILIEDFLYITQYLVDGEPPLRMLEFMANSAEIQQASRLEGITDPSVRVEFQDMAAGLKTLDLFSNSMRSREMDKTWVAPDQVADELQSTTFTYLYLGLVYQQSSGIVFGSGKTLCEELKDLSGFSEAPLSCKNYLKTLSQIGTQLDRSIGQLHQKNRDSISYDDYYRVADLTFDLLGLVSDFRNKVIVPTWVKDIKGRPVLKPLPGGVPVPTRSRAEKKSLAVMRQLYELEFNVRQNHYTSAVNNVVLLLSEVLSDEEFKFKKDILLYGNFMASVAEAQTSQQVADAIELFALPPGSSRMKKYSDLSVSLNSYGGLAGGIENDFDEKYEGKGMFSPSAPLGVGLNFGFYEKGSFSFYTQLIDVGAVFAYRFSNETQNIPEIKFQNILAPGFYGIYGFGGNLPLAVGLGAQLGPNLRKVTNQGLTEDTTRAWRLGIILSVDIPVTHFYTK